MNALIRKEIRLLLPSWGVAMVLAALAVWPYPESWAVEEVVWMAFIFGIVLMSLSSFGHEFSTKTFSMLLAQPVSRSRIWNVKFGLLASAVVSTWMLFHATTNKLFWNGTMLDEGQLTLWNTVIIAMASTALWTTILFRQVAAAFWISLLLPVVMAALLSVGLARIGVVTQAEHYVSMAVAIYSVVGVFAARRLFLRAQDAVWTGGDISLPAVPLPFVNSTFSRGSAGVLPRLVSLFRKELQLQLLALMFAVGGLAAHVLSLLLRKYVHVASPGIAASIIENSWVFAWICWVVLPMFAGAVAVSEERKLGTLEGHLCLPVSRGLQFLVKFTTVMLISVGLGFGGLILFEWVGSMAGVRSEFLSNWEITSRIFWVSLGWAWLGLIAFHCSTLSRNALQAMGFTVVSWIFSGLLYGVATDPPRLGGALLWEGPLGMYVSVTSTVVTLLVLSWFNFKRVHSPEHLLVRNICVLVGVVLLSLGATVFAYHRTWERFLPLERGHGVSRIVGDGKLKLATSDNVENPSLFVLLPDGRIWKATAWKRIDNPKDESVYTAHPVSGEFMSGTDWSDVVAIRNQAAAIRRDGSLWLIDDTRNVPGTRFTYDYLKSVPPTPRQIGAETNWLMLAAGWSSVLALKRDGTLWGWGGNHFRQLLADKTEYVPDLVQVGTNRDWVKIRYEWNCPVATKKDGSDWEWGKPAQWKQGGSTPLIDPLNPVRFKPWYPVNYENVFVAPDGSIRQISHRAGASDDSEKKLVEEPFSFEGDWISVAEAGGWYLGNASDRCFGLKKSGVIHAFERWDFSHLGSESRRPSIVISRHSDWRAIASVNGLLLALAQDGTISLWHPDFFRRDQLLSPSYLPLHSMNIFDVAANR